MAFFAVAQAASVRNGGQSAADSAALAAARDDRNRFFDGFLDSLDDGDSWHDWLDLTEPLAPDGCDAAGDFAGRNDSTVVSCSPVLRDEDPGYTVTIKTNFDTGDTVIPGADNRTGKAESTAVVQPRCDFELDATDIEITCDGDEFEIDPDDDIDLEPRDLFTVVLVD
ncbi:MAG: hypothetical protein ACRDQB_16270 [Thermocrispum sp.]